MYVDWLFFYCSRLDIISDHLEDLERLKERRFYGRFYAFTSCFSRLCCCRPRVGEIGYSMYKVRRVLALARACVFFASLLCGLPHGAACCHLPHSAALEDNIVHLLQEGTGRMVSPGIVTGMIFNSVSRDI